MATHIVHFPYGSRAEVFAKLAEISPALDNDPARRYHEGEVVVILAIHPPHPAQDATPEPPRGERAVERIVFGGPPL